MMEKALTRNDPGRYEIIHVVGKLRAIPSTIAVGSGATGTAQPMASPESANGETSFVFTVSSSKICTDCRYTI